MALGAPVLGLQRPRGLGITGRAIGHSATRDARRATTIGAAKAVSLRQQTVGTSKGETQVVNPTLRRDLLEQLERLDAHQQQQVWDFARALAAESQAGTPGQALLSFAGSITQDDLRAMKAAIDEGCEQVDLNEW